MYETRLISADLNGTLVHQHTMSDMIRIYKGEDAFKEAKAIFEKQTSGTATMEKAFQVSGPLTRGLTLRQAIEYTKTHMKYLRGFNKLIDFLYDNKFPLIINSTGYSVTFYAIREQVGNNKISGFIGNILRFGNHGEPNATISEEELEKKAKSYFFDSEAVDDRSYDEIQATGVIDLGIPDEEAKASLLQAYAKKHFPELKSNQLIHIGDTMGDSGGILGVAKAGGIGIAFNYNEALEVYLKKKLEEEKITGKVFFIDKKEDSADLTHVIPVLEAV
ncbi:hypothetical protein CMO93_00600 [Candidatus Woesearchaeota archaeon]|nr:hypothetical protein [Candidatus Woesearchaeota archaeon]|tara:strand:+ start:29300 stop:30127 length:828 start_codon:yes stop_codon:yes gene_type:complete